jgi:SNF2 family DNA or RNA helicase
MAGLKIGVEGEWAVLDGATMSQRAAIKNVLETRVVIDGDRLKFVPTHASLEHVRLEYKPAFDPRCRVAWAHFYKQRKRTDVEFAFKTKPYQHQFDWWDTYKAREYSALLWEMGLGKSKTAIDIAAWKYAAGDIDAVLVVTLKGVHRNWVDNELPTHMSVPYKSAAWSSTRKEGGMVGLLEHDGLIVATLNFDVTHRKNGEAFIKRMMSERKVHMIIDESHGIKTPSAARTKAAHRFAAKAVTRQILTGTFSTNTPMDVWAQLHFLSPSITKCKSYWDFKGRYAIEQELPGVTTQQWRKDSSGRSVQVEVPVKVIVGYKNLDELRDKMAPHISRILKDDVLDLPAKVYRPEPFELSTEQRKAYNTIKRDLLVEIGGSRVTAPMAITLMLRLQQITCGFVKPDGEDAQPLGKTNPRLNALSNVVEAVKGKAIIWATFKHSLDEIAAMLREQYGDEAVVEYRGETSDDDRAARVRAFQDPDSPVRFFVGQPRAGGTGITLTQARDVIYYNNSFDLGIRLQSEDRAHRIGQTGVVSYTDLVAIDTIDQKLIKSLIEKRDLAASLTGDELKQWIGE